MPTPISRMRASRLSRLRNRALCARGFQPRLVATPSAPDAPPTKPASQPPTTPTRYRCGSGPRSRSTLLWERAPAAIGRHPHRRQSHPPRKPTTNSACEFPETRNRKPPFQRFSLTPNPARNAQQTNRIILQQGPSSGECAATAKLSGAGYQASSCIGPSSRASIS